MALSPSDVDRLLSTSAKHLPLVKTALQPEIDACKIRSQDASILFPHTRHAQAALAGLLLRLGCWDESHTVAQDVTSPEGSYWHAIIHRMEPDSSNAKYWFRRVGHHAIFPELFQRTAEILKNRRPSDWHLKAAWDPYLFIDWCDEARDKGGQAEAAAVEIHTAEWQLLFDWCADTKP
jgi:hypothetical protein